MDLLRDELTGLGSLLALRHQLEPLLEGYQPFGVRPALLLIDIDGFSRINALYGRETGDRVLAAMGYRLRDLVPGDSTTYRTGGDELVALLTPVGSIDAIAHAEQIQRALGDPLDAGGTSIATTVSVAVVMLGHRHRVDGLLRDADVAMYRAKAEGGNRVDVYNWEADSWSVARKRATVQIEKELEELRLQNRVLTEALTLDLATGMPNGLAFEADHSQLEAWRKRTGESYGVLMVEVDGLAEAPARFHSPEGETALLAVGHAVRDTIRQSDRAYALDEGRFAVLLRGATTKHAVAAAERIRSRVKNMSVTHPEDSDARLTLTIAAIEAGFRHPDASEVLREVNGLLAAACAAGGDRITWPH